MLVQVSEAGDECQNHTFLVVQNINPEAFQQKRMRLFKPTWLVKIEVSISVEIEVLTVSDFPSIS
jgi:hypothetical protein